MVQFQVDILRIQRIAISVATLLLLSPLGSLVAAQAATPVKSSYSGGASMLLDCEPTDQCLRPDRQDVFSVEPGKALRAKFGFVQSHPKPIEFRVFLLLNYQQTPFAVQQIASHEESGLAPLGSAIAMPEPDAMQPVWDFTVPPEQEFYFELTTEPLAAGYYDLALLVVPDPNKTQHELRYWTVYRYATRASIYVGDAATPPTVDIPLIDPEPDDGGGTGGYLWFRPDATNTRPHEDRAVNAGEDVTLGLKYRPYGENVLDGQPLTDPVPAAFIAIIDDRVVPINGQPAIYASALPGRTSNLSITVTAPDDPGIHQIYVQQFPYPYVTVAVIDESGLSDYGESSPRLVLNVR